jgi:hypothetical protein
MPKLMEITQNLITTIETTYNTMKNESFGNIVQIGRAIGGIGALIYIMQKVWGMVLQGNGIDFIPLIRPFVLLMLITSSGLLCNTLDKIGESLEQFSNVSADAVGAKIKESMEKRKVFIENDENFRRPKDAQAMTEQGFNIGDLGIIDELGIKFDQSKAYLEFYFDYSVLKGLGLIHDVAYIALKLISFFMRLVLRIVAPISFGLAIWEGFQNNVYEWVGKYLNYLFLSYCVGIYAQLLSRIELIYLNAQLQEIQTQQDSSTLGVLVILLLGILGYLWVPTAANMMVSVGGVSQVTSGLTRQTSVASSSVTRTVKRLFTKK